MIKITLPLPSAKLSPNARLHWAAKSKITKKHRTTAHSVCDMHRLVAKTPLRFKSYQLHFFWKDKRRHDRDNATSQCKAYLDGIADAIMQDDSEWSFDGVRFYVDKTNPRLEIHFETEPEKENV